MTDQLFLDELKQIVFSNRKHFVQILKSKNSKYEHLVKFVEERTPLLNDPIYSLSTKIKWVFDGLTDFPKCEVCGKSIGVGKNVGPFKSYSRCCSTKCANKSVTKQNKIKQTCLEKYGVDNVSKAEVVKNKIKQTFVEKYGETCPLLNPEIQEKSKQTSIKKYGVDRFQKTEMFKAQIKASWRNKTPEDILNATNKSKQTCLEKYGVEFVAQSNEFKAKMKQNLIEKYGDNYKQVLWGHHGNTGQNRRAYQFILKNDLVTPLFSEDEYISKKRLDKNFSKFKFQCKKCNTVFESYWDNGHAKCCPKCTITGGTSKKEKEILEFMSQFENCTTNSRTIISPLELDIYVPTKNLAIEFDGLFWHSDENAKRKHLDKTELCEKRGIHLIHIFENEWDFKQDIVKSRLKNLLGLADTKIFARQCTIKEIDKTLSKQFQDENHIQGAVNSRVNIGLFFKDELVSLMTFSKPRFNKKCEWELLRFCNKLNYSVVGAASKLLSYFEKQYNPTSLLSYADRRWTPNFNDNVYEKLGFKLDHISKPDYWYWKDNTVLKSRVKYQKHKQEKLLENFDPNKTEVENMLSNNFKRIFDCGNLVYIKKY